MIDPLTLGLSTAASVGSTLLKKKAANEDFVNQTNQQRLLQQQQAKQYGQQLDLQKQRTASDVNEAGARTAFGNDFLKNYGQHYGGIADQNYANEATRLGSRMGAIQPTVDAYAAPAQEAERAGLAGQRFGAATAAMGPQATSAAIPLSAGMGKGATAAEYDKRYAASAADASDIAGRKAALGSYDDVWNRNDLRGAETKRGLGLAEAMGKSKTGVINEAAKTNKASLKALPDLQDLVGFQNRSGPLSEPSLGMLPAAAPPTSTALADILGGLGKFGSAVAGSGGITMPNFLTAPGGPGGVPRPTLFGR